jgi:DNA repair exonuclease SbcCD ATPase subunit
MLQMLKLNHYRQHHDTVIRFVAGVNTIVGANGAGKSTIPEAIEFALFGGKALRDTGNAFVTDGHADGSATVVFDAGGHRWQVGRNTKDARLLKDGEPEASYKNNVSRHVAAITGVNQTGYRLGHYVRQKELASFSQLRAGKRQEAIEKMLKIHAVDKVLARLKVEADAMQVLLEQELRSAQDVEILEQELRSAQQARSEVASRPNPGVAAAESELRSLQEIASSRQTELATARSSAVTLEQAHEERRECCELMEAEAGLRTERARLELTVDSAVVRSEADVNALRSRLADLRAAELRFAEMAPIAAELAEELIAVSRPDRPAEPKEEESAISAAATNLAAVSKLRGVAVCPTCRREIADVDAVIASLQETLERVKAESQPVLATYATALVEYNVLQRAHDAYTLKVERRNMLSRKYVAVTFDAEEKACVESELSACEITAKALNQAKHELEMTVYKLSQVTDAVIRTETLDTRIAELETAMATVPALETALRVVSEVVAVAETDLKERRARVLKDATELARLDGRIEELQRSVVSAVQTRETIVELSETLGKTKSKFETFVRFKRYLTAKIKPMIEKVAETLFHRVTKNRFASYVLATDYEIVLTTHTKFIRKQNSISGSENDLANLCLRLAIATVRSNKLVGNLGFIILDEISSSFDDDRTRQTLEGLLELRDIIPQIINITHKPVEIGYADRLITVTEIGGRAAVSYA